MLQSYTLISEFDFVTMRLDPSSLNFALMQFTFSSLTLGWSFAKGGPVQSEKSSGPRTERTKRKSKVREKMREREKNDWIDRYLISREMVNGYLMPLEAKRRRNLKACCLWIVTASPERHARDKLLLLLLLLYSAILGRELSSLMLFTNLFCA